MALSLIAVATAASLKRMKGARSGIELEVRHRPARSFQDWVCATDGRDGTRRRGTSTASTRHSPFHRSTASDARLVGDDDDWPRLIGPESRQRKNAGKELELIRTMDVAAIHIDYAVIQMVSALALDLSG
jgi:hypothetical protein